jgi:hypothetical protein
MRGVIVLTAIVLAIALFAGWDNDDELMEE